MKLASTSLDNTAIIPHPNRPMHLLSPDSERFLQSLPFWNPGEILLSIKPAGEGNMNAVFRIKTNQRSVIAKQSFPFVRKFPQIQAPIDRIHSEYQFLRLIEIVGPIKDRSPKVLAYFEKEHLMILEDLGEGSDFSFLYQKDQQFDQEKAGELLGYLNHLHQVEAPYFPDNLPMRKLNHEHIFHFPFQEENGFDLDQVLPGMQDLALKYKKNQELKTIITKLGRRYLSRGKILLHGDYYPGSWLQTASGTKIIDPEFGFLGDAEFDLGVFMAHLYFAGLQTDQIDQIMTSYIHPVDHELVSRYAGVEIMRRLIGIAQLPLSHSLDERANLLTKAEELIRS
ncbi:phosphotransferase [Algoriphagus namhaensis]